MEENFEVKLMRDKVRLIVKSLNILAYANIVILFVIGAIKASDESSILPLIIYVVGGAITSLLFFVIGVVVDLLFKIYENTSLLKE